MSVQVPGENELESGVVRAAGEAEAHSELDVQGFGRVIQYAVDLVALLTRGQESVEATEVVDPTGCGDAYRAGLLYGIGQKWDWQKSGQLASLMGSLKIASRGGQNHHATPQQIVARYREAFGAELG